MRFRNRHDLMISHRRPTSDAILWKGDGLAELGELPELFVLVKHVLHEYHLVLLLLVHDPLQVFVLVLHSQCAFNLSFEIMLTFIKAIMTKSPSLLPTLLILIYFLLHLLHLGVEVLADLHLSDVVSLLLFLSFPLDALFLFFKFSLNKFARFQLPLTITVQSLMFLVVDVGMRLIQSVAYLLALILQVSPLLLEASQLVKQCPLHFLLVTPNLLLDFHLLLVLHRTLIVHWRVVVVHA